jgi:hypothetical protein
VPWTVGAFTQVPAVAFAIGTRLAFTERSD